MNLFSLSSLSLPSLENVMFQENPLFKNELTYAIQDMFDVAKKGVVVLDTKRLKEIVSRRTNLSVTFEYIDSPEPNASVRPPQITPNHPLVNQWRKYYLKDNTHGKTALNFGGNQTLGEVDLAKGTVSGFFQKLDSYLVVTRGLIGSGKFTAEEVAAVILHEIGHVITYMILLGQVETTCLMLTEFVRAAIGAPEPEARAKLVAYFEKETNVKVSNSQAILNASNGETIAVAIYSDIVESTRSEFGSSIYDMRSWEAISDQYAARQGAAMPLASALSKMAATYQPEALRGAFLYYTVEVLKTLTVIASIAVSIGTLSIVNLVMIGVLLSASPFEREYDKPAERITRLRRELVARVKDLSLPPTAIKEYIADIAIIDGLLKEVKDRESFFEKFWLIISPYSRRQKVVTKELQDLEALVNNDLFLEAQRLKQA